MVLPLSANLTWRQRVVLVFWGLASGTPLPLVSGTLVIWWRREGLDLASITALIAAIGLPYVFKFLWAPLLDAFAFAGQRQFGVRRSWLLVVQPLLLLSILLLALINPVGALPAAIAAAALVAFLSATQDVLIDGWRVATFPVSTQGLAAALHIAGYRAGYLLSTGLILFLVDWLSWSAAYALMALPIALGWALLWFAEEQVSVAPAKRSYRAVWRDIFWQPLRSLLTIPRVGLLLLFILLYRLCDTLQGLVVPAFYVDIGFSNSDIATIAKGFGLFATLAGTFVGGYMVRAWGLYRSLWVAGILQAASNIMYVLLAQVGAEQAWLAATIAVENSTAGMAGAVFVTLIAGLCNVTFASTHYALLTAVVALSRNLFGAPSGALVAWLGWTQYFFLTIIAAIPALLLLWCLAARLKNISPPASYNSSESSE